MISPIGKRNSLQGGFTYVVVLLAVALISISTTITYTTSRYVSRKSQEAELLFRGAAYYHAIEGYYLAKSPGQYPRYLSDLYSDPRFPYKRHIRRLYSTPSGEEWRLVRNNKGYIMGVYYENTQKPIKTSGFDAPFEHFQQAKSYRGWEFVYTHMPTK